LEYLYLKIGAVVKKSDEFLSEASDEWTSVATLGQKVYKLSRFHVPHRRPVKSKMIIKPKEKAELPYGPEWTQEMKGYTKAQIIELLRVAYIKINVA
jgi:hypothetical protein